MFTKYDNEYFNQLLTVSMSPKHNPVLSCVLKDYAHTLTSGYDKMSIFCRHWDNTYTEGIMKNLEVFIENYSIYLDAAGVDEFYFIHTASHNSLPIQAAFYFQKSGWYMDALTDVNSYNYGCFKKDAILFQKKKETE